MIDWEETQQQLGYGPERLVCKRPKVVCRCDTCPKTAVITVRVKQRLVDNQLPWSCQSCVAKRNSTVIADNMRRQWRDVDYRRSQIATKTSQAHRQLQADLSYKRWADGDYRAKLATGINVIDFITKSHQLHGDKFDYADTTFGTWHQEIEVVCNYCSSRLRKMPQKHLEHGYCDHCGGSKGQSEIAAYIKSLTQCVIGDRLVIAPLELDVYVPVSKVAIEYNGIYWHSEASDETDRSRLRHQRKALACAAVGVRLLQFWDFEWGQRRGVVESMIAHVLGRSQRVGARNLQIQNLDRNEAVQFFANNHLYGHRDAAFTIGLCDSSGPVIAASFSKRKPTGYEVIRMATRCGSSVQGGVSRLMREFRKRVACDLHTYADLRYSNSVGYLAAGFQKSGITSPGYFYYKNGQMLARQRCQRSKLPELLESFDPNLSEAENMFKHGWRRCWDAGHARLVWPNH